MDLRCEGMKHNLVDVYKGRIEVIDNDIIIAVKRKQWVKVMKLREEKKILTDRVNDMEARRANKS